MKKIVTLLVVVISIFLITGCENNSNIETISMNEFNSLIENNETFILEIVQSGCSHCARFTPVFKKVLKEYDITAKSLNFSNISQEEYDEFIKKYNNNAELGTPTVMFFYNGSEKTKMNRITGETSEKEIIRKLKQNEYIK